VSLIESLTDLRDSIENPRFREIIAGMIESIEGGKTLSQALAEHPQTFDEVMVSLIRAGEETGALPQVLNNLLESLKWQDELAAHTKKLIMYPAFLGTVVVAITMFMMIYLVPKMAGFIRNMGQELPTQTKILIATSEFFVKLLVCRAGPAGHLAGVGAFLVASNPAARYRFDELKLRLPYIGEILRKIILSRFASVFAMMYSSGITILDSIKATEDVVGNLVIKEGLQQVGELIAEGQNVTAAFQNAGMFPPLVLRMLRVGENTGATRYRAGQCQLLLQSRCTGIDRKGAVHDRTGHDRNHRPDARLDHDGRAGPDLRHHYQDENLMAAKRILLLDGPVLTAHHWHAGASAFEGEFSHEPVGPGGARGLSAEASLQPVLPARGHRRGRLPAGGPALCSGRRSQRAAAAPPQPVLLQHPPVGGHLAGPRQGPAGATKKSCSPR
jgi:hypothetical protein